MKNANKKWCHNVHVCAPPAFCPNRQLVSSGQITLACMHPFSSVCGILQFLQGFVSINCYSCFPAIASIRPWSLVTAPLPISSLFVPTPTPHLHWIHLLLHEMDLIMVIISLTLCGVYWSIAVNMKEKKYGMRSLLVWKYKKSIKRLLMIVFFHFLFWPVYAWDKHNINFSSCHSAI